MFGNFKNMMEQMQLMQRLMKDDNFKAFIAHPKVQDLFKDSAFQTALKSKDTTQVMNHPKMLALKNDPELETLLKKVDFQNLMKG